MKKIENGSCRVMVKKGKWEVRIEKSAFKEKLQGVEKRAMLSKGKDL